MKNNPPIIVETHKSNITSMEHWDGWRRLDNSLGATAKIYAKVINGKMQVYKYVTRLNDKKMIYIIEED
jgi:hypothetical protein